MDTMNIFVILDVKDVMDAINEMHVIYVTDFCM